MFVMNALMLLCISLPFLWFSMFNKFFFAYFKSSLSVITASRIDRLDLDTVANVWYEFYRI